MRAGLEVGLVSLAGEDGKVDGEEGAGRATTSGWVDEGIWTGWEGGNGDVLCSPPDEAAGVKGPEFTT